MKILRKILQSAAAMGAVGLLMYIEMIYSFPPEITMYNGQPASSRLGAGISIGNIPENACVYTGKNTVTPVADGEYNATLKIGVVSYRKVRLRVTKPQSVCASGSLIGLRIYNNGLIVLGTQRIETAEGTASPAADAGICEGDIITKINGSFPAEGRDVGKLLRDGENSVTVLRGGREQSVTLSPAHDKSGALCIGAWVRDSTAGVGTMTYYAPETMTYGALGHGINDSDTGIMFSVQKGTIEKSSVVSVTKGVRGTPGEICGSFSSMGTIAGTVAKNCDSGIFGSLAADAGVEGKLYPVGLIGQVTTGDASILSTVDDEVRSYNIKIVRTMPFGAAAKGLMIKITDERLLEKTGGIVQGMSGSPIIQNGKIVGAVTHVLVNDPTSGYGIYIERMLAAA